MTPWTRENLIRDSAEWMLGKQLLQPKDEYIWWTPGVLTALNKDDNPVLSLEDAEDVFNALKERQLLAGTTETVTDAKGQQRVIPAYVIADEPSWDRLIRERSAWRLYIRPTLIALARSSKHPYVIAIISFIAAAVFAKLFENVADDLYKLMLGRPLQ